VGSLSDQRGSWAGTAVLGDTYVLGRQINRGGMGDVFEATHARLPGRYAVKVLRSDLMGNREAFARFCREAEVMSELRHPNVVQIYDFNTTADGRPYFVMEHLEGRDLETRLVQSGPLPLPAAVRVVESVASALAIAHAHGIVHRDLKPANIFLVTIGGQIDELVKVLDFGISKIRSSGTLLSSPTDMLGSPAYMSPEQARGASEVDGRSDQFALGAITFRMLTGYDPFTGDDIASLLYQVVHEEAPPLARYLPAHWDTRALQAVLDRALAKDPAQRFGGMMELARAFEAASEQTLSHDASERGALSSAMQPNLGTTLIATPPPPPLRPGRAAAETEIVDTPPPVRTPTPEPVLPPAPEPTPAPEPLRLTPKRKPPGLDFDFSQETRAGYDTGEQPYDAERLPVTHHRLALVALVLLALAGILGATGVYRRLVPTARQKLGLKHRQEPPAPSPQPAEVPPVAAPAPRDLPVPAPDHPSAAASEKPTSQEAPAADKPARATAKPKAAANDTKAAAPPRHRHPGLRPLGHPGSYYLAPTQPLPSDEPIAPARPNRAVNPFAQPPGTPPPDLGPSKVEDQFSIPPPAPTGDSPAHDLAPPPAPEEPSPGPAITPPPPPAPPPPRTRDPADQPMPPSF
jgi:serine/threonine-protein kinase